MDFNQLEHYLEKLGREVKEILTMAEGYGVFLVAEKLGLQHKM